MTVIHQYLPATPVVTVDVWVKAGAAVEPEPWLGMAHFLEHMIFKGTAQLPPGQFDQMIEGRGGVTNAATSHDYAHFFINTAADHWAETLPYLAELLVNAAIPDEEFDRERDVVLEEIRQSDDDPDLIAFQALLESLYGSHPYGRPVLGYPSQLLELTAQDMRRFHRAYYQPEHMTIVIVGDVTWEQAIETVTRHFDRFSPRMDCPCPLPVRQAPLTAIRRQELVGLPRIEQARLLMGWTGSGADRLKDAYGLDLLSVLLAGSRTSRLVRELREDRQLVQDIGSQFSLQRESSLLTLTVWLDPAHLSQVEAIIGDRLAELAAVPVSTAELDRCKRLLCNDYAFSTETTSQLAGLYGYYGTIAHPEDATSYPEIIQSFDATSLQHLAARYLSPVHYAVTTVKPD